MLHSIIIVGGRSILLSYGEKVQKKLGGVTNAITNIMRQHPRLDHVVKIGAFPARGNSNEFYFDVHFCCGCHGPKTVRKGVVLP